MDGVGCRDAIPQAWVGRAMRRVLVPALTNMTRAPVAKDGAGRLALLPAFTMALMWYGT